MRYFVPMYSDPAHARAMSQAALDVVARKLETLRERFTESGELLGGRVSVPGPDDGPGAQEIASLMLDDHVTAVEVRLIHHFPRRSA